MNGLIGNGKLALLMKESKNLEFKEIGNLPS